MELHMHLLVVGRVHLLMVVEEIGCFSKIARCEVLSHENDQTDHQVVEVSVPFWLHHQDSWRRKAGDHPRADERMPGHSIDFPLYFETVWTHVMPSSAHHAFLENNVRQWFCFMTDCNRSAFRGNAHFHLTNHPPVLSPTPDASDE